MFYETAQKQSNILSSFVRKFIKKNFQKSHNLVTLSRSGYSPILSPFNGPTPTSSCYFRSFGKHFVQKDSNSYRRSRRQERWPLDHHGPICFCHLPIFSFFSACYSLYHLSLSFFLSLFSFFLSFFLSLFSLSLSSFLFLSFILPFFLSFSLYFSRTRFQLVFSIKKANLDSLFRRPLFFLPLCSSHSQVNCRQN